jgi:hypothetical protein
MRLIQSMKSSIWLVVTPAAGPSPDNWPTMSTGPGATGSRDSERRIVDVPGRYDIADCGLDDEALRRTREPAGERRIDGAGSKPFSNMAAMASALIDPLGDAVERRMVALRRRTDDVGDDPLEEEKAVDPRDAAPAVDALSVAAVPGLGLDPSDVSEGVAEPVRSDEGDTTTGATGKSAKSML